MIYVTCGIPASGKTTLSKQLAQQYNAKLYCYDQFIKQYKKCNKHLKMYEFVIQDLLQGQNVILDDLHLTLKQRQNLISAIRDIPCKKILVIMTTPLEECIYRNSQRQKGRLPDFVIYHLNQRYQPPSLEEGWDDIQYV